jgi:hypothetical protein
MFLDFFIQFFHNLLFKLIRTTFKIIYFEYKINITEILCEKRTFDFNVTLEIDLFLSNLL